MPSPLRKSSAQKLETQDAPSQLKEHAEWIDRNAGDNDGAVTVEELDAFQRQWGHIDGMSDRVVDVLRQALEARPSAPVPQPAATPQPPAALSHPLATPPAATPQLTQPRATPQLSGAAPAAALPAPQATAPTFRVGQLLHGEHRRVPISAVPDSDAAYSARIADQVYGNGDRELSTSELRELERAGGHETELPALREALETRGTPSVDPTVAPGEGAAAMAVPLGAVPARLQALARFMDRQGNHDGKLDSREVNTYANKQRALGDAPLTESTLGTLRLMYQLTNAGQPLPGVTMRADGTGTTAGWPPAASRRLVAADAVSAEQRAAARRIVRAAGSATQADVEAVVAHVSRFPLSVLQALEDKKIPIRVGRDDVTDVERSLRKRRPRGWHDGATYRLVKGVFHAESRSVILATEGDGRGGRRLVVERGSVDVPLHEIAHAIDYKDAFDLVSSGAASNSREFRKAYEADRANLVSMGHTYLTQKGKAGREEAFAEAFAAYVSGHQYMPETMPNLKAYFDRLFQRLER